MAKDNRKPARSVPLRELLGMDAAPATPSSAPPPATPAANSSGSTTASAADRTRTDGRHESPPLALVDGSNVAHGGGGVARLANILIVRDKLVEQGFEPIIVVDAALRHQVDDTSGYERLVETGAVKQAPAGTDADYFLLSFAKELGAFIVSNDTFRDRSRQFAEVRRRVIRFMILADEVVFEKRTSKRKE